MPGLNRYLRVAPCGLLRVDAKAVAAEAKLHGKYLLRCSDPHLSARGWWPLAGSDAVPVREQRANLRLRVLVLDTAGPLTGWGHWLVRRQIAALPRRFPMARPS